MIVLDRLLSANQPEQAGKLVFRTKLNAAHAIYDGHFPGRPITPGVCLLQAAQELLERHFGKKYLLTSCRSVRFVRPVEPSGGKLVDFELQVEVLQEVLQVLCHVKTGEELCAKFSCQLMETAHKARPCEEALHG